MAPEGVRLAITSDFKQLRPHLPFCYRSQYSTLPLPPRVTSYPYPTSSHYLVLPSCAASDFGHPMKHDHLRTCACRGNLLWRCTVVYRLGCGNECRWDRVAFICGDRHAYRDAVCHPFIPSRCMRYYCPAVNCIMLLVVRQTWFVA